MRISTTTLESFRLWRDPEQEWMSEADLIAGIEGKFVPTPAIALGRAFGLVLETPERFQVQGGYRCNGYSFDDVTMRDSLNLIDRRGVFEAKGVKHYGEYEVVAKADQLLGAQVCEFKTTDKPLNYDKYADSCQWRFMVDIFEPLLVTYHIFQLDDHGNGVAEVKGIETFNLFPYAELHADCCELLEAFVAWAKARGVDSILQQRQREAVAR